MLFSLTLVSAVAIATTSPPAFNSHMVGGGNVGTNGVVTNQTIEQIAALTGMGAGSCRTNLQVVTTRFDARLSSVPLSDLKSAICYGGPTRVSKSLIHVFHILRYPGAYISNGKDWDSPTPESMDKFMSLALASNVKPILLFE